MTENNSGKGFSGFDDLVTDVSNDLEQAKQAPGVAKVAPRQDTPAAAQPQKKTTSQSTSSVPSSDAGRDASPVYHSSAGSSSGSSAGKWVIGIIVAIIFISWINNSGKKTSTAYQQPPTYAPSSDTVYTPSKPQEVIPPVGRNNVLSYDQIRYCLSEKVRINAVHNALNKYSSSDVNIYNNMVSDYNSRCSEFRYHRGALQSVQKDVDANRYALEQEGLSRVGR